MKLNEEGLKNKRLWLDKHYKLPEYDREKVIKKTKESPEWIHFGAGNIFRAFQANVVQNLLNKNILDKGLIVVEGYDYEIISKMYKSHDNYSILMTLKSDGTLEKTIIGSVTEALELDTENKEDFKRLKEIFSDASLKMVSFTITEKGYLLVDAKNMLLPLVQEDMVNGPASPKSYIGKVTALLYERFKSGQLPIAMVSMDNCSHNGDKLYQAVSAFAIAWTESKVVEKEFVKYVNDKNKVSFPWTMIDKITPRPNELVHDILKRDSIEDIEQIITSKKTYVAPFVNAEESEYLVIEDNFPNGKINLEQGGIIYTDRCTVDKVEKMKVCTCLNPLHTTLAIFGCLLGYNLISDEMKNPILRKLVENIGYIEGLPVVVDPEIINPKDFINEVLNVRIPNPFLPDTPQRIATDTSQKLAIRFGETIKAYKRKGMQINNLLYIPLVFAGWLRYLMGIDDNGNSFTLSPDPLLDMLQTHISGITISEDELGIHKKIKPILENKLIFGVDLYEVGLGDLVERYFKEMISDTGAVQRTLERYLV